MTTTESFTSIGAYAAAVRDACDSAAFDCYTFGDASAAHYLDVMVDEYRAQGSHHRQLAQVADLLGWDADALDHDRAAAIADAKRDAYADALRVLEIADNGYARMSSRIIRDLPPVRGPIDWAAEDAAGRM